MDDLRRTQLQDVPVEILDTILIKSSLMRIDIVWEQHLYRPTPDHYASLAGVWSEWRLRLLGSWLQIVLRRALMRINPLARYLATPRLLVQTPTPFPVLGLALLDDELYVTFVATRKMAIYARATLAPMGVVRLVGVERPRDIGACAASHSLYVVCGEGSGGTVGGEWRDHDDGTMFRVNGRGALLAQWGVRRWDEGERDVPLSLTVTGSSGLAERSGKQGGRVLVTSERGVREFTPDGVLLRGVAFAPSLYISWQTLLRASGEFVVSQGWSEGDHFRVYSMSADGALLHSSEKVAELPRDALLPNPVYSTLDPFDLVLVADSWGHRVTLLSPSRLIHLRNLIGQAEGLKEPSRLVLDAKAGRLYVGTNGRRLMSFQIFKP